jgi:hypothetical protein
MKTMNIRPAFRYRFGVLFKSASIFYMIMVLVTAGAIASFIKFAVYMGEGASSTVSAFGISAVITVFIFGICNVREHLRLCLQHGVSRSTAFVSELAAAALVAFLLAAAGEILLALAQILVKNRENLRISDFYQDIFAGPKVRTLTPAQHVKSLLLNFTRIFAAYTFGSFISLLFFRLNKFWTTVVAIGVPVFFIAGLPLLMRLAPVAKLLTRVFKAYSDWVFSSVWRYMFMSVLAAAVLSLINWLLMRRAPVRPAKN